MAEPSAQQQIQELKDLVVNYAKQETIDPIKNIGRYVGWALGGAFAIGVGMVFVAIGVLRFAQTSLPEALDGSGRSSWFPYFATLLVLGMAAALTYSKLQRASNDTNKDER